MMILNRDCVCPISVIKNGRLGFRAVCRALPSSHTSDFLSHQTEVPKIKSSSSHKSRSQQPDETFEATEESGCLIVTGDHDSK